MTTRPVRIVPCNHEHRVVRLTKGPDWWWTRYVLAGTRITPNVLWGFWSAGDSIEFLAKSYGLCTDQVQTCIDWCEKRSAAAKKAAATRQRATRAPSGGEGE